MKARSRNVLFYVLVTATIVVSFLWLRNAWWAYDSIVVKNVTSYGADLSLGLNRGSLSIHLSFAEDEHLLNWITYSFRDRPTSTRWWPYGEWWHHPQHGGIGFSLLIPDWMLIILFGGWPTWRIIRRHRTKRRRQYLFNRCQECGYDLRGSIEAKRTKCPECGQSFQPDIWVTDIDNPAELSQIKSADTGSD